VEDGFSGEDHNLTNFWNEFFVFTIEFTDASFCKISLHGIA
jgi:hypothetical protein